jgi:HlyD family secretion protein
MLSLFRWGGSVLVRWPVRLVLMAGALLAIGYIPYNYEVTGECRLIPVGQVGVRARLEDEIVAVHVGEGEQVSPGGPIVTLSGRSVRTQYLEADAELAKAEADLDMQLAGYRPEQIRVAEDKVRIATIELDEAEQQLKRGKELVPQKAQSVQELEKQQRDRDEAAEKLKAAEDELREKQLGPRDEQLRAAEADVKKAEEKLKYYKELWSLTEVRSPIGGRVVTPYLRERLGAPTKPGDLVAVVQDTSKLLVEVAADDASALDVREGAPVHVRLYGNWGRVVNGHVVRVALTSEQAGKFGNAPVRTDPEMYQEQQVNTRTKSSDYHVRVYVELDDQVPDLAPEMTGYARIVVDDSDVLWRSLARPVARFLRTDVWSWLP